MLKFIPIFLVVLYSQSVWSACDPDTVEFYLDKGFTPDQVTELCTQDEGPSTPTYEPYQKPVVIYQQGVVPGNSVEESKAIEKLRGGIKGRSIDITPDRINYIANICVRAGNSPERDQRIEECIDIAFSIARKDLIVERSGSRFLVFGEELVTVSSSDIKRKFLVEDPWVGLSPDLKFLVQRKYESQESGNTTNIPIRKSSSVAEVISSLRTLAATTDIRDDEEFDSEVAKVLDDSYVPPTQEEYIATQPTYEELEEEEKKKGKWWNPFD
ncbi:MAG: hypothetical protein AAGB35_01375 [Pseudomonadota bacterium]